MYISHTGRLGDLGAAFDGEMTPRDDKSIGWLTGWAKKNWAGSNRRFFRTGVFSSSRFGDPKNPNLAHFLFCSHPTQ